MKRRTIGLKLFHNFSFSLITAVIRQSCYSIYVCTNSPLLWYTFVDGLPMGVNLFEHTWLVEQKMDQEEEKL